MVFIDSCPIICDDSFRGYVTTCSPVSQSLNRIENNGEKNFLSALREAYEEDSDIDSDDDEDRAVDDVLRYRDPVLSDDCRRDRWASDDPGRGFAFRKAEEGLEVSRLSCCDRQDIKVARLPTPGDQDPHEGPKERIGCQAK